MLNQFCKLNNIPEAFVHTETFMKLNQIATVEDVLRSSLWNRHSKTTMLRLYKKAKTTGTERHWMSPATLEPLIKAKEQYPSHPFDECPLYLIHFVVSDKGEVRFQPKLRLFRYITYRHTDGNIV